MIFPQNRLIRKRSLILYFNSNKLATLKNNNNFLQANLFLFSSLLVAKKTACKKIKANPVSKQGPNPSVGRYCYIEPKGLYHCF